MSFGNIKNTQTAFKPPVPMAKAPVKAPVPMAKAPVKAPVARAPAPKMPVPKMPAPVPKPPVFNLPSPVPAPVQTPPGSLFGGPLQPGPGPVQNPLSQLPPAPTPISGGGTSNQLALPVLTNNPPGPITTPAIPSPAQPGGGYATSNPPTPTGDLQFGAPMQGPVSGAPEIAFGMPAPVQGQPDSSTGMTTQGPGSPQYIPPGDPLHQNPLSAGGGMGALPGMGGPVLAGGPADPLHQNPLSMGGPLQSVGGMGGPPQMTYQDYLAMGIDPATAQQYMSQGGPQ